MADAGKQAGGNAWGDDISDERKEELERRLQAWEQEADHGEWKGPFDSRGFPGEQQEFHKLTGADVFWLAARMRTGLSDERAVMDLIEGLPRTPNGPRVRVHRPLDGLHLEGADLTGAHLEGADLTGAHLEGASLGRAYLEGVCLVGARLEGASFWGGLSGTYLEGANLSGAHLEGANLRGVHLEGAKLGLAHLEGASLWGAHLEGKAFRADDKDYQRIKKWVWAWVEFPTTLPPADLRLAFFDSATTLKEAVLGSASLGGVSVADVHWGDVNLAVVDWSQVGLLGDERMAKNASVKPRSTPIDKANGRKLSQGEQRNARQRVARERLQAFQAAARANRQLATVLRSQGLTDEADRFAYRAQLMQRVVLRRQAFLREKSKRTGLGQRLRKLASYLGSGLLDLIAGYGYRPGRSILAYIFIICAFAGLYLLNGQFAAPHLRWDEALVLSISSFHGRGFFTSGVSLGDTLARLAAGEAIVGLLLEITFIATFTNRFFAR